MLVAPPGIRMGFEGGKDPWNIQTYVLMDCNKNSPLLFCVPLHISQLHSSFPTSVSGQPIFLSTSEAIASGKWIWWILSGNQHPSDCQILGEETEMLRSCFRARYTCPWGPGDGKEAGQMRNFWNSTSRVHFHFGKTGLRFPRERVHVY